MFFVQSFFYSKLLLELNFYFLFFSLFLASVFFYVNKYTKFFSFFREYSYIYFVRFFLIFSLLVSFSFVLFSFFFYIFFIYNYSNQLLGSNYFLCPQLSSFVSISVFNIFSFSWIKLSFSIDFFGLVLLLLAYIVGFISILALDNRLYWKNVKYLFCFNIFALIVFLYVSTTNFFFFFNVWVFVGALFSFCFFC